MGPTQNDEIGRDRAAVLSAAREAPRGLGRAARAPGPVGCRPHAGVDAASVCVHVGTRPTILRGQWRSAAHDSPRRRPRPPSPRRPPPRRPRRRRWPARVRAARPHAVHASRRACPSAVATRRAPGAACARKGSPRSTQNRARSRGPPGAALHAIPSVFAPTRLQPQVSSSSTRWHVVRCRRVRVPPRELVPGAARQMASSSARRALSNATVLNTLLAPTLTRRDRLAAGHSLLAAAKSLARSHTELRAPTAGKVCATYNARCRRATPPVTDTIWPRCQVRWRAAARPASRHLHAPSGSRAGSELRRCQPRVRQARAIAFIDTPLCKFRFFAFVSFSRLRFLFFFARVLTRVAALGAWRSASGRQQDVAPRAASLTQTGSTRPRAKFHKNRVCHLARRACIMMVPGHMHPRRARTRAADVCVHESAEAPPGAGASTGGEPPGMSVLRGVPCRIPGTGARPGTAPLRVFDQAHRADEVNHRGHALGPALQPTQLQSAFPPPACTLCSHGRVACLLSSPSIQARQVKSPQKSSCSPAPCNTISRGQRLHRGCISSFAARAGHPRQVAAHRRHNM